MQKKNSRKVLLINPRFQLAFLSYMVLVAVLVLAIFYVANAYYFSRFLEIGYKAGLPEGHQYFGFFAEQQRFMNWVFAITAVVAVVAVSLAGLVISHRVAGPLYRLCKHMEAVDNGQTLDNVNFRKGDFFPEVADAVNKQLGRYREIVGNKGSST